MRFRTIIELGCAIFLLAAAIVAYVSWFTHVGTMSAEAAALDAKRNTAQHERHAPTTQESVALDEAVLSAHLLDRQEIVPFLENVEERGLTYGAKVEVVSVSAPQSARYAQFSLRITGTFDAVLRTIGTLEYGQYEGYVRAVELEVSGGETSAGQMWVATTDLVVGVQDTVIATTP